MCSRDAIRDSSHISFFCGRDPICEVEQKPENKHEELTGLLEWPACLSLCLRDQWTSPFVWLTTGSLRSVQNYRPYIVSQVPSGKMNILLASRIFCLCLVIGTCILPFFFPVICWSYLRTEISVTLSIGNKLYSSPSFFIIFFQWPTLLMLSCDRIESAKFIVAS